MVQTCIFGIVGLLTCCLIEQLSIRIMAKKCRAHAIKTEQHQLSRKHKAVYYSFNIALWAYTGFQVSNPYLALLIASLFSMAIMTSIVDIQIHIIPNEYVAGILFLGVLLKLNSFSLLPFFVGIGCMIGTAALFLIVAKLTGMHKVGAGDIKLAGAMGFLLGYPDILTALAVMSSVMMIFCFAGFSVYKLTLNSALPMAPFLMIGMSAGLIWNIIVS